MAFEDLPLHPIIRRNLGLMGYERPTPIQEQVIAPALENRDLIGLAQTGTGKTAAFIVPIAHHLISVKPPPIPRPGRKPEQVRKRGNGRDRERIRGPIDPLSRLRALVLCPTRELAQQVAEEARAIVQGSVLRVACAYGKVALSPQVQAIAR